MVQPTEFSCIVDVSITVGIKTLGGCVHDEIPLFEACHNGEVEMAGQLTSHCMPLPVLKEVLFLPLRSSQLHLLGLRIYENSSMHCMANLLIQRIHSQFRVVNCYCSLNPVQTVWYIVSCVVFMIYLPSFVTRSIAILLAY